MIKKIITSIKNINFKLYISLLIMGLVPTIYTTLRVFWLGNIPGEWSYSIAGQLSWINLIYEIINESIILPLFYFLGKSIKNKKDATNMIKTGLIVTLGIYLILSVFIISFTNPLLKIMATNTAIIEASAEYIRIESVSNIFVILSQFTLVGLVSLGKDKYVYYLTCAKLLLCVIVDLFLVSSLDFSLNLGVNGIGLSNIIVNFVIFLITLYFLSSNNLNIFNKNKLDFKWMKELLKVGGISGIESFVRNIAYMIMIVRMVNVVNEQGIYWVVNNFIWGWLLLPIIQLGELIKQEISTNKKAINNNTLGYISITLITIILWVVLIPVYKPFMRHILNFSDVNKLFNLLMVLFVFYIMYALQNIFDSTFYGLGKTHYMLFESIVTNSIYYGIAFILYLTGVWKPSLIGIALLFGIGNAFDAIVSLGAYCFLLKKYHINILNVESSMTYN